MTQRTQGPDLASPPAAAEGPHSLARGTRELYPFSGHWLRLDGNLGLHYLDEGQGDPVVMLHGNPTWSFFYRNLVLGLRDRCRIVVPDHIGCGLSDKPDDAHYAYTLRRRVDDLESLLDHLHLHNDLTLVLHDWGGMIGMALAHRYPERIRRLVILNTAAFRLPPGKRLPWQLRLVRNTPLGALLVRGLNAFSRGAVRSCVVKPLPSAVRQGYLTPYNSWRNRIAVLRFVQDIPLAPGDLAYGMVAAVEEGLDRFTAVPMLVCWGLCDFVFDGDFLAEWRRRFPAAEVHAFADAGHLVLEDAGGAVLDLVRDFLHRHPLR
jgi:haloalkane dehalogenase